MTLSNLDWEIKKNGVGCSIFSLKSKLSVTSGGYLRVKNSFQSCFQNPSWPGRKIEKEKILNRVKEKNFRRCLQVFLRVFLQAREDTDLVCLQDFLRQEEMNLHTLIDTVQDIFRSKSESVWISNGKG